ncbi:hypothetical protein N566_18380 [Streptomycetaceae bacterium MP113-05]|nr:hypothetical protein N566_18380 [Streptomycetaceae bacterium MP113-05]
MADPHRTGPVVLPSNGHGAHWRRDLVELAALFTAVTVTDLAAKTIVGGPHGVVLLAASALVLVCTVSAHTWWSRHRRSGDSGARAPASGSPGHPGSGRPVPDGAAAGADDPALWRLRVTVREQPGALAALCSALAGVRVNVLAVQTMPLGARKAATAAGAVPDDAECTVDELLVRAPAVLGTGELSRAVASAGGSEILVEPADAHHLVDGPARALGLAARIVDDSAELPPALRLLLGRCTIRAQADVSPAGRSLDHLGERDVFAPHRLQLADPSGGLLVVERPHAPFTPVEYARARSLVALDRRLGRRLPAGSWPFAARDGSGMTLRRADVRDLNGVRELHGRCSPDTLAARYHGPVAEPGRYLGGLLSPHAGRTVVAQAPSGRLVAVGHLLWDGEETEVALLVEDAWQGRGVGGEVLRRLVGLAEESGCPQVYAVTRRDNRAMISVMRGLRLPLTREDRDGAVVLTVRPAGERVTAS